MYLPAYGRRRNHHAFCHLGMSDRPAELKYERILGAKCALLSMDDYAIQIFWNQDPAESSQILYFYHVRKHKKHSLQEKVKPNLSNLMNQVTPQYDLRRRATA